jgi:hypothetical protein
MKNRNGGKGMKEEKGKRKLQEVNTQELEGRNSFQR